MKKLEILVVEDNELHREAAKQLLTDHNVAIAEDFVGALKLMGHKINEDCEVVEKKYDVVLTDMMFPMGGEYPDLVNMVEDTSVRYRGQPLGYAMVLFAAKQDVPYAAVLTDMDHHHSPISATFDLFYDHSNKHGRQEFKINGTKCIMFDNRDLPNAYLLKSGLVTEQSPYRLSDEQTADYALGGTYGGEFIRLKNWKAVLNALDVKKNE